MIIIDWLDEIIVVWKLIFKFEEFKDEKYKEYINIDFEDN